VASLERSVPGLNRVELLARNRHGALVIRKAQALKLSIERFFGRLRVISPDRDRPQYGNGYGY
jgi:hypothetical protein